MIPPETKYTKVGDSDVAYQVVGDGPIDLVYVTGIISNVDLQWEFPPIAKVLERMASYSRLIMFDRRGSGISDPIALDALPTWEHWVEDLSAVLDAAGSKRAAILAQIDGGFWGMLYAATHPERTSALVLWDPWAASLPSVDYEGISRGPGEVVCSRTVKDLVAGSEFAFDDRGLCTLKGVPEEWQLYVVRLA